MRIARATLRFTHRARVIEFVDEKSRTRSLDARALRARDASRTSARSACEALRAQAARKKDWHLCALTD
jgi:hypothetical protein